jgi:hypothetical protein
MPKPKKTAPYFRLTERLKYFLNRSNLATFAFDAISDSSMAVSNKRQSGLSYFFRPFA